MVYTGSFRQIRTYPTVTTCSGRSNSCRVDQARLSYEPNSHDEQHLLRASSFIGAGCSVLDGLYRFFPADKNLPTITAGSGRSNSGRVDHARLNYEPSSLDEQRLLRASSYIGAGCSSAGWVYTGSFRQIRTYPPPQKRTYLAATKNPRFFWGRQRLVASQRIV